MEEKKVSKLSFDKTLVIVPIVFVALVSIWFIASPEGSLAALNDFANFFISKTGWFFLLFAVFITVFSLSWAFGKYSKIRLGGKDAKPKYSMLLYVSILFCAGMAAGSVIFSMSEWMFYYTGPPFGIEPKSLEAAAMALPYEYFNWGIAVSSLLMLLGIPYCYSYYIRKNPSLQLGDVVMELAAKNRKAPNKAVAKLINLVFIICVLGSLSCTMGLGIPNITKCLVAVFGFTNPMLVSVLFIVITAVVFSFSNYLGISKGLAKLSKLTLIVGGFFLAVMLFGGDTLFILNNITNSFGQMIQHYPEMAFNADAVFGRGFGQNWTVFFYCYCFGFVAMTAVIIVKTSYGRTFREMILGNTVAVPAGLWIMFGINSSNGLGLQLSGKADIISVFEQQGQHEAIIAMLRESILGPTAGVLVFTVMIVLFVATTMDAAAISLAETSSKALKLGDDTHPLLRLIWCIVLTLIPLTLTFVNAGLSSLQSLANLLGWPIMVIGIILLYHTIKQARVERIDKDMDLIAS